jgi:hypothetical protein
MADMNEPLELPAALIKGLAGLGLEAQVHAGLSVEGAVQRADVTVSRAAAAQRFDVVCGRRLRIADIARVPRGDLPRFVFTDYVPDATGAAFRRAGVGYLDEAGNAWISFSTVLVDVRGRRRVGSTERLPVTHGNLFSPGSAQVVLALLAWPSLWRATRRDLAHVAGTSLGKAHDVLAILKQAGFGPDAMQRSDGELLDLWAAAYPTSLARRLLLGTFHGPVDKVRSADRGDRLYVSGEVAAGDLLRPATLDVYVAELGPRLALANRWRTDGPPNIVVRRSFWQEPGGTRAPADEPVAAPWPLVYADLLASTDPRVRAAAGDWKDLHAGSPERS